MSVFSSKSLYLRAGGDVSSGVLDCKAATDPIRGSLSHPGAVTVQCVHLYTCTVAARITGVRASAGDPRSPAHSRNVSAGIILIVNSSAVLQSSAVLCCITALMPEYVHQDRTNRTFVNQMQL